MNRLRLLGPLLVLSLTTCSYLPAGAQPIHDCAESVTCNNGAINKTNTTNTQNIGDHQDNIYAPDSATANASNSTNIGDTIAQGGTGGNSTATGNSSHNDNKSSATIGNTTQSNTGNNNTNAGGNFSQGDMSGGNFTQGAQVGGSVGDTVGGNAQGGNATGGNVSGGSAHTNSGSIDNTSGVSGSGNSDNTNVSGAQAYGGKQGQRQSSKSSSHAVGGSSASKSSGGNSRNSNTQGNRQQTNVDASSHTTYREAANTVIAPQLNGYGPGNCFGDTNPSGSFSAALGTIGWQATAGSSKASNVCSIYRVGGERAALAYLATMDRNAHRALIVSGVAIKPSQVRQARELPSGICQVVNRHRNGMPKEIKAYPKEGFSIDQALNECLTSLQLFRVK